MGYKATSDLLLTMTSNQDQLKEQFPEAYRDFEIDELLAKFKETAKTENIKLEPAAEVALLGRIYRYDRKTIASKGGYAAGAIGQVLSKQVYRTMELLFPSEDKRDWQNIDFPELLKQFKKNIKPSKIIDIEWSKVSHILLEQQKKRLLTSYSLGSTMREIPEIYVGLELVKREGEPRIGSLAEPEQWSTRQQEKQTPISNDYFFDKVLKEGKSPKSNGKRIGIIGEAGAGKTTLLQKISSEMSGLRIWIDLADPNLKTDQPLEDYLIEVWLSKLALPIIRKICPEAAPNPRTPTEELKDALFELLQTGEVWLLLDGADEMASKFGQPLAWINRQLQDSSILKPVRIVLTCRLNIWSTGENYLPDFDVYRNLDFTEDQVSEFIEKWFINDREACQNLKQEIEQANERIKSLINNPLRLTLLCLTWTKGGYKLPETKAGLYQRFVEGHYKWKEHKEEFRLKQTEQRKMNRLLGELAKTALDSKESRFRIRKSLMNKFAEQSDEYNKMLELAIKLDWLVPIGLPTTDEKDADETVYAFYHPTFQEYFAALSIDDWDFFLPRDHVDRLVTGKPYRVFEPQWKEVFLLYMGLPSYRVENQSKDNLINKILNFDDGCGENFYQYRSYILAAIGLSEWNFLSEHSKVVKQLIEYYVNSEKYSNFINLEQKEEIKLILKQLNQNLVVQEIIEFEKRSNFEEEDSNINRLLNDISRNNQKTIETIIDDINNIIKNPDINKWYMILYYSLITLEQIAFGNQTAINTLIVLVINTIEIMLEIDSYLLAKIKNNEIDSNHNLDKIKRIIKSDIIIPALRTLSTIAIGNLLSIEFLNTLIEWEFTEDPEILSVLATSLYQIYPSSNKPIKIIEKLLLKPDQEVIVIIYDILKILEKIANPEAVTLLIKAYKTESNIQHKQVILESLGNIDCETVLVTKFLKEILLIENQDSWISIQAAKSLAKLEPGSVDAIDALTTIISTSQYEYLLLDTSVTLLEISEKTISTVKPVIERLCKESSNSYVCFDSAKKLIEIDNENPIAVQTLIDIYCRSYPTESLNIKASKILSKLCYEENKIAIESILQFIQNNHKDTLLGSDIETFFCFFEILINSEQEKKKNKKMIEEKMINIILTHLPLMNNPNNKVSFGFTILPRLFNASKILMEIEKNHDYAVKIFIEIIDWMSKNLLRGVNSNYLRELVDLCPDNLPVIKKIIDLTFYQTDFISKNGAIEGLKTVSNSVILTEVVKYCKHYLNGDNNPDQNKDLNTIIWHCAQHMSYPEFHQAWHEPNQESIKQLETQYNDIGKLFNQLQPTDQVYPILIDGKCSLKNLTDESAIAQELCNQIYEAIFPDDDIPTVKNAPELKRLFPKFKRQLNILTLVFIIYNIEPYPELINVCRQLLGKFHIAFITDQQIEPDLRGFPMQKDLVNILQNWLTEISYKETF